MPELFPTFETPDIMIPGPNPDQPAYLRSPKFDFERGDFVLDGAGRLVMLDGHRSWAQWCAKCILTERLSFLAYSSDFGAEIERTMRLPSRQATESELIRVITEALLADPRTESVSEFQFQWVGDEVFVTCLVTPTIGSPERIEVRLSG